VAVLCDRKRSLLALGLQDCFRCVPNENGALSSNRHYELLVWCNSDLCDGTTVSRSVVVG